MSAALRIQLMLLAQKNRFDMKSDLAEVAPSFTTEKYLLDELDLQLRDAFEEHLVDCQVCAFDFWAGATLLALLGCRQWRYLSLTSGAFLPGCLPSDGKR